MSLVTNFDDILSLSPSLIASKALEDCLQSRLIKVNQHRHIINLPLNEIAVVEATSVSEREFQLLGNVLRNMRLNVRDDGFIVAPSG